MCPASMAEPFESSQCVDLEKLIFIYIRKCIQLENIQLEIANYSYFSDLWLKHDKAMT